MSPQRCLLVLAACAFLRGQETVHHASVSGRVLDESGAVIAGAKVTVRGTETNLLRESLTDSEGRFRFAYLKIGPSEIRVSRPGFADSARALTLSAGGAYELSFSLKVGGAEATVTVESEASLLQGARSQVAGTVSEAEVRALPLNGRSFLDLALLVPGVSPTNTGSNQLFAETSAVPGQGISVGSQRNFSNNFVVDGLSANDDAAGLSGVFYGLDTVQEFQVVTSGAQAELGRALGGFINVVTKSGTNSLRGDLYGYFRNQRLNAANPLSNNKLPSTQAQYGASLGGPLKRDRNFFFTNFEQRQLNQSGLVTITPANLAAINSRLDSVGFAGLRPTTGIYPNPVHLTNVLAKVDHQFSARDQFSVRYSLYNSGSRNSRGAGALSAASASSGLDNTDHTIAMSNIRTLSARTVNETRGQYTHSDLIALPTDVAGPAVSISGIATFGRLSGSPAARLNHLTEIVNNLSHQAGGHAIRVGGSFLYNDTTITFPRSVKGSYAFSSLANFLSGTYNNLGFTQTFGNTVVPQTNPNAGIYLQDEWKVRPSLTLNAGLRYDLQFLQTIRTDRNNVSPRAGFAWSPFASRRTVVRGGFGLYYDRIPLRALANALLSSGNTTTLNSQSQISLSLSPTQAGAPVFPNILTAPLTAGLVNFTTMDPRMQNAYSTQGSLEIEHQLGARSSFTVGYQYLRGIRLIVAMNQNVPTCVAAGANNGCRPNPNYANNSQYRSQADSNYHGLHISFQQRPIRFGSYRISYAFSKSLNNVGEFFFSSPIDPTNLWRDYARSDDDQRHRITVNGALNSPTGPARGAWQQLTHGYQLSGFLQYYSALPLNLTTGVTTIQGTAARPLLNGDFISRNAGIGNDFFSINARASRTFSLGERVHLEALAEAFNLLNHRNNLTRNGVFGPGAYPSSPSPTFSQVTAVQDPRGVQLALRFRF
ncbi:MAG: carboxypeptidase regulatory-like domain-containing protein [Bryobacteraceae bacterium]|nr:carboxypeptidase regulatory-like domain-containing protein [Bryobacteraceae bacterium]